MNDTPQPPEEGGGRTAPPKSILPRVAYVLAAFAGTFETMSLHSLLASGRPASGVFTGLVVLGVGLIVVSRRPMAPTARTRLLAGAAIVASVVAMLGLLVLHTRMVEAGVAPAPRPFVYSGLLLAFQTGWALTYWLTAVKGVKEQSRFVPAAVGVMVLLGGGLLAGDLEPPDDPPPPRGVVYKKFATAKDLISAKETTSVGGEGGTSFAHYHSGGEPLLGVSLSTREWFRRVRISDDILGVFEPGAKGGNQHLILAQPGYVVTAIEVQADDYINALRVQFAPYDGVLVSPFDRYWSDWVGSYQRNQPTTLLEGGLDLVVGVRGTGGMVLNSLGLLVADGQP